METVAFILILLIAIAFFGGMPILILFFTFRGICSIYKFVITIKYNLPYRINGVWYNSSLHSKEFKYPVIFDEKGNYISAEDGLFVQMNTLSDGRKVFYKIADTHYRQGGDWIYGSDNCSVDLVFAYIEKLNNNK